MEAFFAALRGVAKELDGVVLEDVVAGVRPAEGTSLRVTS